jgi:hypothetical protein
VELGPQPIGEKRPTSLMLIGCVARTVGWKEALGPGASRVGVWGTAGVSIAAEGREPGLLRVQPVRCPGKLRLLVIKRNVRPAVGVERGDINLAPTGWARHWLASPLVPRAMEVGVAVLFPCEGNRLKEPFGWPGTHVCQGPRLFAPFRMEAF